MGKRFTSEVKNKIRRIRKYPELAQVRYQDLRTAVLVVFPFMIHYRVNHNDKTVIISAVYHTSINPEKWEKRK